MRHYRGSVWDDLYAKYGSSTFKPTPPRIPANQLTVGFQKYVDTCTRRLELFLIYPDCKNPVPEIAEMSRIGVEGGDGIRALLKICAEKKDTAMLDRVVNPYLKGHFEFMIEISRREIIYTLYDRGFYEGLRHLDQSEAFCALPTYLFTLMSRNMNPKIQTCCVNSVLCHESTNLLGHAIVDYDRRDKGPNTDLLFYLLKNGYSPSPEDKDTAISIACLTQFSSIALSILAQYDVDFSLSSDRNVLGIPDALFLTMFYNPNVVPFILTVGGLSLVVPGVVQGPSNPLKCLLKRPFVCCELGRYRGMLQLLSEFSLILPLCARCMKNSGLSSPIPSLMSICRMTYRSQFSSSKLMFNKFFRPDRYDSYLTFEANQFDSKEFLQALRERKVRDFKSYGEYMLHGESYELEEATLKLQMSMKADASKKGKEDSEEEEPEVPRLEAEN